MLFRGIPEKEKSKEKAEKIKKRELGKTPDFSSQKHYEGRKEQKEMGKEEVAQIIRTWLREYRALSKEEIIQTERAVESLEKVGLIKIPEGEKGGRIEDVDTEDLVSVVESVDLLKNSSEKVKELFEKVANAGSWIEQKKNRFFRKGLEFLSRKPGWSESISGFFDKWSKTYAEREQREKDFQQKDDKTKWQKSLGALKIFSNLGKTLGIVMPHRLWMMGTLTATEAMGAAKEQRLSEEEMFLDEKTAYDEAWDLHEKAKIKDKLDKLAEGELKEPDREALNQAYCEGLPDFIVKRLEKGEEQDAGRLSKVAQHFMQKTFVWRMRWIDEKIKEVQNNSELNNEERQAKINNLLWWNKKFLQDMDGAVKGVGVVDTMAYGLKSLETAGKIVSAGLIANALWRFPEWVYNLWEHPENIESAQAVESPLAEPSPTPASEVATSVEPIKEAVESKVEPPVTETQPEEPVVAVEGQKIESAPVEEKAEGSVEIKEPTTEAESAPVKQVEAEPAEPAPAVENAIETGAEEAEVETEQPGPEKVYEYRQGTSIWGETKNQIEEHYKSEVNRFTEGTDEYRANLDHATDTTKRILVKAVEEGRDADYGLEGVEDPNVITEAQLKSIKWNKVFAEAEKKDMFRDLKPEEVENIVSYKPEVEQPVVEPTPEAAEPTIETPLTETPKKFNLDYNIEPKDAGLTSEQFESANTEVKEVIDGERLPEDWKLLKVDAKDDALDHYSLIRVEGKEAYTIFPNLKNPEELKLEDVVSMVKTYRADLDGAIQGTGVENPFEFMEKSGIKFQDTKTLGIIAEKGIINPEQAAQAMEIAKSDNGIDIETVAKHFKLVSSPELNMGQKTAIIQLMKDNNNADALKELVGKDRGVIVKSGDNKLTLRFKERGYDKSYVTIMPEKIAVKDFQPSSPLGRPTRTFEIKELGKIIEERGGVWKGNAGVEMENGGEKAAVEDVGELEKPRMPFPQKVQTPEVSESAVTETPETQPTPSAEKSTKELPRADERVPLVPDPDKVIEKAGVVEEPSPAEKPISTPEQTVETGKEEPEMDQLKADPPRAGKSEAPIETQAPTQEEPAPTSSPAETIVETPESTVDNKVMSRLIEDVINDARQNSEKDYSVEQVREAANSLFKGNYSNESEQTGLVRLFLDTGDEDAKEFVLGDEVMDKFNISKVDGRDVLDLNYDNGKSHIYAGEGKLGKGLDKLEDFNVNRFKELRDNI